MTLLSWLACRLFGRSCPSRLPVPPIHERVFAEHPETLEQIQTMERERDELMREATLAVLRRERDLLGQRRRHDD